MKIMILSFQVSPQKSVVKFSSGVLAQYLKKQWYGCKKSVLLPFSKWMSPQDYQVDLYLRQHWFDPRLNHSEIKQVAYTLLSFSSKLSAFSAFLYLTFQEENNKRELKKIYFRFLTSTIQNWSKLFGNQRWGPLLIFFINENAIWAKTIHFTNCANCGNKVLGKVWAR